MQTRPPNDIVQLVGQLAEGRINSHSSARRATIRWALTRTQGNVSRAAQMLGTSRGTIYRYARS